MKFIISFLALASLLKGNFLLAQNEHFTKTGIIEFEKSVNMYAIIKRQINKNNEAYLQPMYEQYVKNQPQFKKLKSTLSFADNKTIFTPTEEESVNNSFFNSNAMIGQNNTIFTNLQASTFIAEKKVFEETFLVIDSTRKINWKITDETRKIAGYNCRRANALILDSVYVVAFYTDEILASGGPESFTGLPGMILGVALPHENITWFATKVTDVTVDPKALTPPKKGKPTDYKALHDTLLKALKNWGNYSQSYLKAFSL